MDEIVKFLDKFLLLPIFNEISLRSGFELIDNQIFNEGSISHQIFILYFVLIFGGIFLYFFSSGFSYYLFFIRWKDFYHPKTDPQPFPGQVALEIKYALWSVPYMATLTVPFFLGEINGYSKLYDSKSSDYGWNYFFISIVFFILWSDTIIYWIHRELHDIPWLYKNIHKGHHLWKVPTPFAAIAFHPLDGWAQSLPYHIFPYVFPMDKWLSLVMFLFVQLWTVMIHDGVHMTPFSFVNGAAHHTFHHSKFQYNYGQYFTWWDKLCGSYMNPFWEYDRAQQLWIPTEFTKKQGRKINSKSG